VGVALALERIGLFAVEDGILEKRQCAGGAFTGVESNGAVGASEIFPVGDASRKMARTCATESSLM